MGFALGVHQMAIQGPMFDMPTTLSKFLYLGLSLDQIFEAATIKAARAVRLEGVGTLDVGAHGDIATWTIDEVEFTFSDVHMNIRKGNQLLVNQATFIGGELLPRVAERPLHKFATLPAHQADKVIPVRAI